MEQHCSAKRFPARLRSTCHGISADLALKELGDNWGAFEKAACMLHKVLRSKTDAGYHSGIRGIKGKSLEEMSKENEEDNIEGGPS
ncbi:hypothetical protein Leryth_003709 [Lithospermum erythrorhizon]|nr:hypothetical protein Leryth_003709 [Lithospermum erythrorhizon]